MSKLSKLSNEFKRNTILFYYTVLCHVFTMSIFGSLGVGTVLTILISTLLTVTGIRMYKKYPVAMFMYKLSNWIMLICSALAISKGLNVLNGYGPLTILPNTILFIISIITFVLHLYGIITTKSLKKNYFNDNKEKIVNKTNGENKGEITHSSETTKVVETPGTNDFKEVTAKKEIKNEKKEKKKRKQSLQAYIEITLILLGSFCLPNLYKVFNLLFIETGEMQIYIITMAIAILGLICSFTGLLLLKKTKLGYIIIEREEKNRKSVKQIVVLFGIVLLIITLLIAVVGLHGYKIVKFVDITQEEISKNSMEFNEIIDNTVNKEDKKAFYENFDVKTIKKYGNTIIAFAENDYVMKYINDENLELFETKNRYMNTGEKVNHGMYVIKTNEEIKTIGNIQVVKDNKMKDYWFLFGGEEVKDAIPVNDVNTVINGVYALIELTDRLEYIHTSKDGIDTVKCINSANTEIILKIDPKTAELHYYQVGIGNSNTTMLFMETDISTINVPDDLIKSIFQITYLVEKYTTTSLYQDAY